MLIRQIATLARTSHDSLAKYFAIKNKSQDFSLLYSWLIVPVNTVLCKPGVAGSIPGETINRGPSTIIQDKLLRMADSDEAGDYAVSNVLSPRDLVFRHDLRTKTVHTYVRNKGS